MDKKENWWCFFGFHLYEKIGEPEYYDIFKPRLSDETPIGELKVQSLQCEVCGKKTISSEKKYG